MSCSCGSCSTCIQIVTHDKETITQGVVWAIEDKEWAALSTEDDQNPPQPIDEALASNSSITKEPLSGSYIRVDVNGLGYIVGDGVKTKDCYFSGDNGATARSFSGANKVIVGDRLYWNSIISGYTLQIGDVISVYYLTTP